MAPTYVSNYGHQPYGPGGGYQSPGEHKFFQQPFRPSSQRDTLPGYLGDKPMPPSRPSGPYRFYNPASPLRGVDPGAYSPLPLPGQKQLFPGLFGSPGQVPNVPYTLPKIPYSLLARALTINPYIRAGATLLDILSGLQSLPVTSLTKGAYDMTGWTPDCSSPSGAAQDKVTGIGPFGPGPLPCPDPLEVPAESFGADLTAAGAASWVWISFGPGTFGGVRMTGENTWRRALPGSVPPFVAGFPFWERHPYAYNPLNPDTWLPGQPVTLLPKVPVKLVPQRKYPPLSDGRLAPRKDNGTKGDPDHAPANHPDPNTPDPHRPPLPKPHPGPNGKPYPTVHENPKTVRRHPFPPQPPAVPRHPYNPPGPKVREKKYTPKNYATWKGITDIIGILGEFADAVNAIYDALPWQITQWKGRDGKWHDRDVTPQDKLRRIAQNIKSLNASKAVHNLLMMEAGDRIAGAIGQKLKHATRGLADQGYWEGLLGLTGGPAT